MAPSAMEGEAHIFWDNSNVFIPAQYVAAEEEGPWAERKVRIHFENLYRLASFGREVGSAFCAGSVPPELKALWDNIRDMGVEVELYERGDESGTEQGVDQTLQVHMLRAMADNDSPQTAVLLTGDGAGYETGIGFHADLERMYKKGWGIEVISWDNACNESLKKWAQEVGAYIPLEDYYDSVTFLEKTRDAKPLSMNSRPYAERDSSST